jgi:tetratricopeptide (TPR) repeat protein
MSDSFPASRGGATADADRDARIEQLLLSGLDQYFAGNYQQAINIWTRVVFLERGHNRARAYIERARSALAERQRECEELVHTGIDAYNAGDVVTARDLLTRAVEQGGANDTALVFLDRLSRVTGPATLDAPRGSASGRSTADVAAPPKARRAAEWLPTIFVSVAVAAMVLTGTLSLVSWFTDPAASPATEPGRAAPEPLPVVRSSEIVLARARSLYSDGHLRDALRTLQRIDSADPIRPEADRLRADVQRALLEAATGQPQRRLGPRP